MRQPHPPRALGVILASTFTLCAAVAQAADPVPAPAPAPAPSVAPGPPGPAAAAPAAPASPPPTGPVSASETPAPPEVVVPPGSDTAVPAPVEEESFPAAWFRIDSDLGALQLWAGATHMLSDSVGIATDMYVNSGWLGEFDIGPSIIAGPMYITPMLGLQVDWANHRAAALVPQLYVTGGPDPIYTELWLQNYEYTVFDKSGVTATGGGNYIYGRFFIDYKVGKYFAVGPEIEFQLALNSKSKVNDKSLTSLPIGLNFMLPNYGKNNNFFIFAGYETQDTPNDKKLAGRLTFVRNF
jgi:hypothetical protein